MLRKFATLPNIPLSYSYPAPTTHLAKPLCAQFGYTYAATEVAEENDSARTEEEDEEDEDMTDCTGIASETESVDSSGPERRRESSGKQSHNLRRDEEHIGYEGSLLMDHDPGSPSAVKEITSPWDQSEWQIDGGLYATTVAFEGTFLLEASLESIAEWSAGIVWKMFLRQAQQCTSSHRHQYTLPLDTPTPRFLPKLLTKAMPRYKGGMTRAIIVTYALLYLHRIKTCFHCTRSTASTEGAGQQKPTPEKSMDITSQCSLFFSVGMHYASLWLLDCCPAEHTYWKRYVQCVPSTHGVAWSRLVLQHWNYQINVTVEDWLSFCSQVLIKFPFVDDKMRTRLASNASNAGEQTVLYSQ